MSSTSHDAQLPETEIDEKSPGRPALLGDDPAGREELTVEHLEDRVLMSSDAAVAVAPPETAAPAPTAYVGSQQPGERTSGGPTATSGSPIIEPSASLAEAVDAAADATVELARGEGESRGAASGTPGNPQAPSRNEPKEPVELTESKSEVRENIESLVEHGEKHEPSEPNAEREGGDAGETRGDAPARSAPATAIQGAAALATDIEVSGEATGAPAAASSNLHQDLGEGAVETKLEVVAEVDLTSLRQPPAAERATDSLSSIAPESQAPAAITNQSGERAAVEQVGLPSEQPAAALATGQNPTNLTSAAAADHAEVPQAHDAVFDRVDSQGVADAVQAGAPELSVGQPSGGHASAQNAAAALPT